MHSFNLKLELPGSMMETFKKYKSLLFNVMLKRSKIVRLIHYKSPYILTSA
jgi:hypothetical protein